MIDVWCLRRLLVGPPLVLALLAFGAEDARAFCTPASASNIVATCSGTTINQGGGAPGTSASTRGYGTSFETSLTVNVLSGATVTGTNWGLYFADAIVTNAGSISGAGSAGVSGSGTTYNYGTITGGNGVTGFDITVLNYGDIVATNLGVNGTFAKVTNYGAITGNNQGVSGGDTTVLNYGTISGANQYGVRVSGDSTVTNYGTIVSATGVGVHSNSVVTVNNYGTILASQYGVYGNIMTVNNTGTIAGTGANAFSLNINGAATVNNSGTLRGGMIGTVVTLFNSGTVTGSNSGGFKTAILVGTANVTNTGTISAPTYGIRTGDGTVTNSGVISGNTGISFSGSTAAALINSGSIIGTGGTAVDFSGSTNDTLTLLPGSRITGAIKLGGNDAVTMTAGGDMSSLTTFTPNGAYTLGVNGSAPFVVSGNTIAVIDPTAFAGASRTAVDVSRAVFDLTGERLGETFGNSASFAEAPGALMAYADAGRKTRGEDAFAHVSTRTPAREPDGGVWAKAFGGQRVQQSEGAMLRSVTGFYGGVIGYDRAARPDLRLGVFAGGGQARQSIDVNSGGIDSDMAFGGVYGRWSRGASYVDVALSGGISRSAITRNIANNLAPGGMETAKANADGWFAGSRISYGHKFPLGGTWSLTPAVHLNYVVARTGGYSETGSSANLTVGARTSQNLEERGDMTLERMLRVSAESQLRMMVHGGVLGVHRLGGTTVDTVVLGQALSFAAPGRDNVAGLVGGAGFEWRRSRRSTIFAGLEYSAYSDSSSMVSGKAGLRLAFD